MRLASKQKEALLLLLGLQFLLLVVMTCAVHYFLTPQAESYREFAIFTLLFFSSGFMTGELLLAPLWAGLACQPIRLRLPGAVAAAMALVLSSAAGQKLATPDFSRGLGTAGTFATWFILFLVLLVFALPVGHFLRRGTDDPHTWQNREHLGHQQFGLRDLLFWTAGVAVALTIGVWIVGPPVPWSLGDLASQILQNFQHTCYLLPTALLCVAAALHARRRWIWYVLAASAAVFTTMFQMRSFLLLLRTSQGGFDSVFFLLFTYYLLAQIGAACGVLLPLTLLSHGGWRLIRPLPSDSPGTQSARLPAGGPCSAPFNYTRLIALSLLLLAASVFWPITMGISVRIYSASSLYLYLVANLCLFAFVVCQPVLFAAWAAFSPGPLSSRLPAATTVGLLSMLLACLALNTVDAPLPGPRVEIIFQVVAGWAMLMIVMVALRHKYDWQIVPPPGDADSSQAERPRSSRYRLLWLAAIALLLGLIGGLLARDDLQAEVLRNRTPLQFAIILLLYAFIGSVLAVPGLLAMGAAFDRGRRLLWLAGAVAAMLLLPLAALPVLAAAAAQSTADFARHFVVLLVSEVALVLGVYLSLVFLVRGGWRLERPLREDPPPSPPAAQSLAAAPPEQLE